MLCFSCKYAGLPQPEGPTMAVNSPGATENDMWASAGVSPDFV